jgi:hypothetical protein
MTSTNKASESHTPRLVGNHETASASEVTRWHQGVFPPMVLQVVTEAMQDE